jgi:hypothetical protein
MCQRVKDRQYGDVLQQLQHVMRMLNLADGSHQIAWVFDDLNYAPALSE